VRARNGWAAVGALAAGLGMTSSAWAQDTAKARVEQGIRIDQLQPASPDSPFLRAMGSHEKGVNTIEFAFGLSFDYGMGLLRAVSIDKAGVETVEATPVAHAMIAHVGGSITPLPWMTIDLALPVGLFIASDIGASVDKFGITIKKPDTLGVGDPRAGVHFRPIDKRSFGVIAGARVWAPVGSEGAFLSDKRIRAEVDVGVAGERDKLRYGCMASISPLVFVPGEGGDGARAALACAAHWKATKFLWVGLEPSFAMFNQVHASLVGAESPSSFDLAIEPLAAVRMQFGGLQVGLTGGPGFGGAAGTPGVRGVLTVGYVGGGRPAPVAPKGPSDRDLDKIPDKDDACPDEAGPTRSDLKENGCPSPDKDGDGVFDADDACQTSPGIKHESKEANGCPDQDNDQLPEPIDKCPSEPGPSAAGGCPKHARLEGESFVIKPPIKFATGDQLSTEGQAALEEIAATMRANPKIEQVSISLGTKGVSADMSDRRAQAIIFVLRSGSLDSNRYEVVLRDDLKAGTVLARIIK
jgi:hypothetical protein